MKAFFSFIKKLFAFLTLICVVFYSVGFFLSEKTKRINKLFEKTTDENTEE